MSRLADIAQAMLLKFTGDKLFEMPEPSSIPGSILTTAKDLYEDSAHTMYRLVATQAGAPDKARGQYPRIRDVSYLEDGEGGKPTVYIEHEGKPAGLAFCLSPGLKVLVIPA